MKQVIPILVLAAACGSDTKVPVVESAPIGNKGLPPADPPSAERGKQVFESKGCNACHTIDGTEKIGPSLRGAWARMTAGTIEFTDGTKMTDPPAAYLRESIFEPNKRVVKGYPPASPSFEGQLTDEELESLTLYVQTL